MIQAKLELHPGVWWLVPFRPVRVPGVWAVTWLCLSLRLSK